MDRSLNPVKLFFTRFQIYLLFGMNLLAPFAHAEIVERILAVVNDKIVTQRDLDRFTEGLRRGGMTDELLIENPKEVLSSRDRLIDAIIDEKIVDSEVKKQNLDVTLERVEQEILTISERNSLSRTQLKQTLKDQGVSFAEYQDFIKKRLERQALVERAVTSKIKISDDEVAAFYMSRRGSAIDDVFEYALSHILFLPKNGDVEGAKSRADAVLNKLKEGGSFDTLASQYSEDPNFTNGGTLGIFKSGDFSSDLEKAAQSVEPGKYSEVVKSKSGFHILRVDSKKAIPDPDFVKKKEDLRGILYQQAFKKQFSFWLDQKRQDAFIRINK